LVKSFFLAILCAIAESASPLSFFKNRPLIFKDDSLYFCAVRYTTLKIGQKINLGLLFGV